MQRTAVIVAALCFTAVAFAQTISKQSIPSVAGNWAAVTKMPDRNINEQWALQQNGNRVTGTAKGETGELQIAGEIDEVGFLRVEVKDGDMTYKVRATLDSDSLDGSLTMGKKEYIWAAKRSK